MSDDAARGIRSAAALWLRQWHRWTLDLHHQLPAEPTLLVANHGFGGIFDLNAAAAMVCADLVNHRPTTILVHEVAWTLKVGPVIERFGAVPARRDAAREALAAGRNVLVFPGGDEDAFKAHRDRDRVSFSGHTGFAWLAIEADVPVVPIVTAGAGDTLFVLSDGRHLARALRLDEMFRLKALPITVSVPWGLSIGAVGFVPYLPLPVPISTAVLEPMRPQPDENATAFAARITDTMQDRLNHLR